MRPPRPLPAAERHGVTWASAARPVRHDKHAVALLGWSSSPCRACGSSEPCKEASDREGWLADATAASSLVTSTCRIAQAAGGSIQRYKYRHRYERDPRALSNAAVSGERRRGRSGAAACSSLKPVHARGGRRRPRPCRAHPPPVSAQQRLVMAFWPRRWAFGRLRVLRIPANSSPLHATKV